MHVFVSECVWELSSSRQKVAHAYNSNNSAWSAWLSVIARSFSYSLTRKSDSESESESVSRWEQAEIVSEVGASSAFVLLHAIQYYSIRLRIKLVSTECSAYEHAYIQKTRYIHIYAYTHIPLCVSVCMHVYYIFLLFWFDCGTRVSPSYGVFLVSGTTIKTTTQREIKNRKYLKYFCYNFQIFDMRVRVCVDSLQKCS